MAASTAATARMIPRAVPRNAGLGTSKMAASDAITVKALKGDRFAGGGKGLGHGCHHAGLITGSHPPALTRQRGSAPRGRGRNRYRGPGRTSRRNWRQIDTGVTWVASTRAPAATIRPTRVSMRGRPAATRLPKATTKMTIVTGQDSISERNMALRLTALKSAQRALAPVRVTEMPGPTGGGGD